MNPSSKTWSTQYGYVQRPSFYNAPSTAQNPPAPQKTRNDIGVGSGDHVYAEPPKKKCGIVRN